VCLLGSGFFSLSAEAQINEWTWIGGGSNGGSPAVYGTLGTPAVGNVPGGRDGASSWTDSSGNLWLFGGNVSGFVLLVAGSYGRYDLNDLWKFNPITKEWAWMGGSSSPNQPGESGVYGTLGVPAAGNFPGGRDGATTWTDNNGNLWLFGGEGVDANGTFGILNDLWEFNPSTNQWAWEGGSNTFGTTCFTYDVTAGAKNCAQPGVYGTLGTPTAGNIPGSRLGASAWTDSKGNLWLFGGWGYDMNFKLQYYFNDLWEFNPSTKEWTWAGGSSTGAGSSCFGSSELYYSSCGEPGAYGTLGTSATGNNPGSRNGASSWIDNNGNFWLFGGQGFDSSGQFSDLNDLWEFNPSTKEWTWWNGSSTVYGYYTQQTGVYGTSRVPAAENTPATRWGAVSWTDHKGNLWLFGGQQTGWYGNSYFLMLNDLWEFNPPTNEWTWMGGSNVTIPAQRGVYGTLGAPAPENNPGARFDASNWTDSTGNFWFFGGLYPLNALPSASTVYANDLWEYQPSAPNSVPAVGRPSFSPPSGTYTSTQLVTISDATNGATIYYTTDVNVAPTTGSTMYTGAIKVSSTETIQAIAVAPGYNDSAITSATYTINLPKDFSVSISPASISMNAGQSGMATISLVPINGFDSTVSFSCTGLPAGTSCNFSPSTVTPSNTSASTTLTMTTVATSAAARRNSISRLSGAVLTVAFFFFGGKKRRRLQMLLLLAVSVIGTSLLYGCGGSSKGPQPIASTVTVTASAGSLQHTATILLTVN
jgi:Uncharacterized protein conserved in bacteria